MNKLVCGLIALLTVVMVIGTSSCRHNASGLNELEGTHWMPQSINGNNLLDGSYISLYFCWGRIRGYAGCNTYGAEYTVEAKMAAT
jgi:heat shock protein HslJ